MGLYGKMPNKEKKDSSIESLSPDDASQANFAGSNRIRMNSVAGGNSGPSPLNRGVVGFFYPCFL